MILSAKHINTSNSVLSSSSQGVGRTKPQSSSFDTILSQTKAELEPEKIASDPFVAMRELSSKIESGSPLSSRALLLYQIRAGQYGMRVELLSKIAESANTSLKRLQNQG